MMAAEVKVQPCFQHDNVNITVVVQWQYWHARFINLIYIPPFYTKNVHKSCYCFNCIFFCGFTPCKPEQPLGGMELKEKEAQND